MMDLCSSYRGTQLDYRVMETSGRSMLKYSFPLSGELLVPGNWA
jgi:translation elongation factor EF-4